MNCYRIYSFFIHKLSNAAKVINKGHLRGFSLPNVHYANIEKIKPRVTFTPSTELKKELADNSYETVKKDDGKGKGKQEEGGTPSHP